MSASIRSRLLLWQISALLLTALMASGITFYLAWDAFNRIRDYGLEQIAYSVVRHGIVYEDDEDVRNDRGQFVSQIWAADGKLFYSSIAGGGPPRQAPGRHAVIWDNAEWRVFALNEGGLTIQVATTSASRVRRFLAIAPWLGLPVALLVIVLGLLIRAAVTRALKPLQGVRDEIAQRDVQTLHAIEQRNLPDEVAPLVATLNDLLVQLDQALLAQRRFIADAAHELRTPLAAVRLQAQIAERAQTAEERHSALSSLACGIDRAAHLVDQLLSMARLEPAARQAVFVPIVLDDLVKAVVSDMSSLADARGIDLGVGECSNVRMTGQIESLRMLLGNLIDNALRYTQHGGRVDVELCVEKGVALVSVEDNGPGIPATDKDAVFERFYRLAGTETTGSGLGLAIVKQVVVLHGGQVTLVDRAGGGLRVEVRLPLSG